MNYYERHIGDYLKDTAHLSLLQHGIYARLMDVYYTREGALPEADALRLIGARSKDERAAALDVLAEFFSLVDGAWAQGRCDAEIARYRDKQEKAKRSANARWSESGRIANEFHNLDAQSKRTHSESNAHQTPDTNTSPLEKKAPRKRDATPQRPDDVDEQVWADWCALRAKKRTTVSATAVDGARSEAGKAGMSLDAFLRIWCARGSQGLQADWIKPNERPGSTANGETPRERSMRQRVTEMAPGVARRPPGNPPMETIDAIPLARLLG